MRPETAQRPPAIGLPGATAVVRRLDLRSWRAVPSLRPDARTDGLARRTGQGHVRGAGLQGGGVRI